MRRNKTYHGTAGVTAGRRLGKSLHWLSFRAPRIAAEAVPGQFVLIRAEKARGPLLKRAFSVADAGKGVVSVYFEIKGEGTRVLSGLRPGDRVSVSGPLGNGFDARAIRKDNVLIAGGCGAAPLLFLAERIRQSGRRASVFYGARSSRLLPLSSAFRRRCTRFLRATDDGSAGKKGVVTDFAAAPEGAAVFACGPAAMLRAVAKRFPEALLALETPMACGMGVCMGCAVRMADGALKLCCQDGPVFRAKEVAWD